MKEERKSLIICLHTESLKLTALGLETISLNVLKTVCKLENSLIVYIVLFISKISEEFRDGEEKGLLISFTGKIKTSE